ncbi:MAG TPA: hypothetical protein VGQ17_13665 [Gemmatimonadales bacterium]|nr:hypothetical protein [Gemmatimonadales bacterium]
MLAYVFWHWKQAGVAVADYEAAQRGFHAALAAEPPPGFHRSLSLALSGAPWAGAGGAAYEDWYLVDGMAALEPLNQAAVTASRRQPHDSAAALAAGGRAGLYALRAGTAVEAATHAAWFAKPGHMSYAALDDLLAPIVAAAGAGLWMRQMVLGPTPEFCLWSTRVVALPPGLAALRFGVRVVWSGATEARPAHLHPA